MKMWVQRQIYISAFLISFAMPSQANAHIENQDISTFISKVGSPRKLLSYKISEQLIEIESTEFPLRIEVLSEDVVKIRYAHSKQFQPEYTWSIDTTQKWKGAAFEVKDQGANLLIQTSKLTVKIKKDPMLLSVLNNEGEIVLDNQSLFADIFLDNQNIAPGKNSAKRIVLGARFAMKESDHFYGLGEKFRGPGDQSIDWKGRKRDPNFSISDFGNTFEGADGGANGNLIIPFLLTNRGASVFLDTAYKTYWEFDSKDAWYVKQDCDMEWELGLPKCEKSEMRFYVSVAKDPKTLFTRYTQITGKPIMPPRWIFGFMQSKYGYENWNEVHTVASELRSAGFPLDALFLDLQWFGGVPGVHYENFNPDEASQGPFNNANYRRIGSLEWHKNDRFDFSNAQENLARLKKDGIEIVPIQEGYLDSATQNFSEGQSHGFLARTDFNSYKAALYANGDDATDWTFNRLGYFGQVGMADTSSQSAREWFWQKHVGVLNDGAATFWTDLGEPERFRWWWKYANGLWHQDVHNVWDLNRARMIYDGFTKDFPERRPFVLSRSGYAGSQRYGAGIWSADAPARLHWAASQASVHLNLSISGIPYTTSDIGGFGGLPVSTPAQYTRWLQMESFSSLTRSHGNATIGAHKERRVHPHEFQEKFIRADGVEDTYANVNKKYLLLRESLVPYLYTFAFEAYETGMPILRALPLLYPNDDEVVNLGSEYLFGSSILVAPVLTGPEGNPDTQRDIYLPEGDWIDLHNGNQYSGKKWLKNFDAPLEKLPLFAKAGAIIPKALPLQTLADERYEKTRILEIYPSIHSSEFILYDDNGSNNDYKNESHAKTRIQISIDSNKHILVQVDAMKGNYSTRPNERAYHLEIFIPERPNAVEYEGEKIKVEDCKSPLVIIEEKQSCYNQQLKKLYVMTPASKTDSVKNWVIH